MVEPSQIGPSAQIIDGKRIASERANVLRKRVTKFVAVNGAPPALAVVLVGSDPASAIYVRRKGEQCQAVGIESIQHRLPHDTTEASLLYLIAQLNRDAGVHGMLVQLPLPAHIGADKVLAAIDPDKDVDGFHVTNAGQLALGKPRLAPCTPLGCMLLLRELGTELRGKHAVVIGRSTIVGRPMAQLLLIADCTVTIAHRHTTDLAALCRAADIVVSAVGIPALVRGDWIRPGAIVIDVGINRVPDPRSGTGATRIVGDVAFEEAVGHAGAITPVPGGVGPMTISCLLENTLQAAELIEGRLAGTLG
ncbi:bifunctional methylenetetrahydrofolate dehydrogenase/methenyltetrahydrofolate cyclohydrolase FolD [Sphingomonas sp. MG17]|uniref:Bifunctional protein FolD n=1 Tax=Sphingomonas tagetis TaxID=2949092 RepID=A0A9X2HVF8_9SPHN|nr:bifunctional methylenetetrahydrofolate dehydrogenase/methenyltetrahydrofolate cyclohydrolase FolD [Sphingomonas tagetis]MCP3732720.1 bifunctional methylenetetrahydrofolate dehydrogenase/methenyltetrahydrofolate cyclohydrolase FolD [Sphingomonas tagetis]